MKTQIMCAMRNDDNVLQMLRELEDEQECALRMVHSGEAALLGAKKRRPDILVIDAVLPLMDGLGTIDRLKDFYAERTPRVIGGYMMPFAQEGFLRRGVTNLVHVPWEPEELKNAILKEIEWVRDEIDWAGMAPECERAEEILSRLGMRRTLRGYQYLACSAALVYGDEGRLDAVGERIYKPVAEHFGTGESAVERLIRHAVETVMDARGVRRIYGFFGNSISPARGKPTNAEMIGMLAQHMRMGAPDGPIPLDEHDWTDD